MTTYSGWQLEVKIQSGSLNQVTGSTIGGNSGSVDGIRRISYEYTNRLERHEATGQRTTYAIREGQIGISGTVERFWTGSGTDKYAIGSGGTGSLGTYYIGIYPNSAVTGQPYIAIDQVKFGEREILHRPGSSLMTETLNFEGIRIYTGSVPA